MVFKYLDWPVKAIVTVDISLLKLDHQVWSFDMCFSDLLAIYRSDYMHVTLQGGVMF